MAFTNNFHLKHIFCFDNLLFFAILYLLSFLFFLNYLDIIHFLIIHLSKSPKNIYMYIFFFKKNTFKNLLKQTNFKSKSLLIKNNYQKNPKITFTFELSFPKSIFLNSKSTQDGLKPNKSKKNSQKPFSFLTIQYIQKSQDISYIKPSYLDLIILDFSFNFQLNSFFISSLILSLFQKSKKKGIQNSILSLFSNLFLSLISSKLIKGIHFPFSTIVKVIKLLKLFQNSPHSIKYLLLFSKSSSSFSSSSKNPQNLYLNPSPFIYLLISETNQIPTYYSKLGKLTSKQLCQILISLDPAKILAINSPFKGSKLKLITGFSIKQFPNIQSLAISYILILQSILEDTIYLLL
ncbi:hypothetical protein IMG5_194450 [Ichthyophthirius multifiliis]|uniref:Transmembrane protein n=1 Tax=Ichthyophthirius multifiliis TaxID=5932 RepID=G0R4R7_ICHMU|nr:hypothetical protein IMG5_194450 [Ichthyophthirius multifiliis]EGR27537.1 hypothetical protein IMG5_194450 [Ichthyophthirius multifiliis]|eukprot:XP_004024989.1 hypothetical protein IMG5_194450 [Ichthyophthirius multifiliis]